MTSVAEKHHLGLVDLISLLLWTGCGCLFQPIICHLVGLFSHVVDYESPCVWILQSADSMRRCSLPFAVDVCAIWMLPDR